MVILNFLLLLLKIGCAKIRTHTVFDFSPATATWISTKPHNTVLNAFYKFRILGVGPNGRPLSIRWGIAFLTYLQLMHWFQWNVTINIAVCKTQMPPFPNMWRVGLIFDLDLLTWMSIGIIYSSRTIYLPSLKLQGQSVPKLSVAQGLRDWHDLWPWSLTYSPENQ